MLQNDINNLANAMKIGANDKIYDYSAVKRTKIFHDGLLKILTLVKNKKKDEGDDGDDGDDGSIGERVELKNQNKISEKSLKKNMQPDIIF